MTSTATPNIAAPNIAAPTVATPDGGRDAAADERWFATLINARSQLGPEARERFDDETAGAVKARHQ